MREEWRERRLGDLCEITKGTSPTLKTPPGPYPLIVTGPEPSASDAFQFDGEAVCVPLVSSTGHGHASLKRVHYASGRFAVANIIAACLPYPSSGINTRYLFHYLQHFKDELIVTRMKGTANVSLSIANLSQVPVLLPPLVEQRRIVDLIAAVDDAIVTAEAESENAAGLLRAALDSMLTENGPTVTVADLAVQPRGLVGGPFGSSLVRSDYDVQGVPVIRGVNMPGPLDKSIGGDFVFVSPEKAESLAGNQALPGDVIFTQRGTIGQVGIVPDEPYDRYVVSQSQMRLRVNLLHADPDYVRFVFTAPSMVASLKAENRATANPHINLGVLSRTSLPLPHLDEQLRLVSLWGEIEAVGRTSRETADDLRALRSNLLTALLSGEHEIPSTYDQFLDLDEEAAA